MDILTVELFDVTVSQALTEVNRALEQHPGLALRIVLDGEEMVLHNLLRYFERQERKVVSTPLGDHWQLDIAPAGKPAPPLQPIAAPVVSTGTARPLVVLRSAFAPGDRALGRRLLLGVLEAVRPPVPWVVLAHEALELLEDPLAMEVLGKLQSRGVPVRLSRHSLSYQNRPQEGFDIIADEEWQLLAGQGGVTLL